MGVELILVAFGAFALILRNCVKIVLRYAEARAAPPSDTPAPLSTQVVSDVNATISGTSAQHDAGGGSDEESGGGAGARATRRSAAGASDVTTPYRRMYEAQMNPFRDFQR